MKCANCGGEICAGEAIKPDGGGWRHPSKCGNEWSPGSHFGAKQDSPGPTSGKLVRSKRMWTKTKEVRE
jgi:hypothetical protein